MNLLDVIIVTVILFGGYLGFRKGLVIELCTLLALGGGIYIGLKFSGIVTNWIQKLSSASSEFIHLVAFGISFLVVVILVFFIGKWLERFVKLTMLKPIDRILGGVFALAKFMLIISVVLLFIERWNSVNPVLGEETKNNSLLYKPLVNVATVFSPVVESELGID